MPDKHNATKDVQEKNHSGDKQQIELSPECSEDLDVRLLWLGTTVQLYKNAATAYSSRKRKEGSIARCLGAKAEVLLFQFIRIFLHDRQNSWLYIPN